ncbi:MAG: family 16 glycosylhydrolase [Planctomycetota bacterium]|nr:family 16 glycosylhydrolase [Planctomycetota bacterium]
MLPLLIALTLLARTPSTPTSDRWELVFEDDFTSPTDPTTDWTVFGGTSVQPKGRTGPGLLLTAPAGLPEPAYAGAITTLGGGAIADETVTATMGWRRIGSEAGDAFLAIKLEFKDHGRRKIGEVESIHPLAGDGTATSPIAAWEEASVSGRVPAGAATIDVALVLVPGTGSGVRQVMIDDLSATTAPPAPDLLGQGDFEANDGNAPGWTAFNNATAVDDPRHDRVLKTWGPFNEPYGGSGFQQVFPLPGVKTGSKVVASVEAITTTRDSIRETDNFPVLRLECLAANGRPLAHIEARPFDPGKAEVPVDQWVGSEVTLEAPEGTASAKVILVFVQPTTMLGAVLFRNPSVTVDGVPAPMRNPEFASGDSTIPGWRTVGAVSVASRDQRSGAGAALLEGRTGETAEIGRVVEDFRPGTTVRIEGWIRARGGSAGTIELRQTAKDGSILPSASRRIALGDTTEWVEIAGPEGPFDATISPRADRVELVVLNAEPGGVMVDDLVVQNVDDLGTTPRPLPVRNPSFDLDRPDPKRWLVADGQWSHNGELQYYSPDAIRIDDGRMLITADPREVGDRKMASGHVSTQGLHSQTYGKWEIRAKLPGSQGMWPALWLLPTDGSWPPEIDIIELVGKDPDVVHHSFHWGPLRDGKLPWDLGQTSTDEHRAEDYANTWHDFGVEWTPRGIVWTVDGKITHRFGKISKQRKLIPDQPMYLIMNLAVGGFWPGPPGQNTEWPSVMEIDSVRVYRLMEETD